MTGFVGRPFDPGVQALLDERDAKIAALEARLATTHRSPMNTLARRVILESPYGSPDKHIVERNEAYARDAMHDCLMRGEAPYASHLLYTQPGVLDDRDPDQRKRGIDAGFAWRQDADATVVYADLGVTEGMLYGTRHATQIGRAIEFRSLPLWYTGPAGGNKGDTFKPAVLEPDYKALFRNLLHEKLTSNHPFPWHIEADWTQEVIAANGVIVAKLMSIAHAQAVIDEATQLCASRDACNLAIECPRQECLIRVACTRPTACLSTLKKE